MDASPPYDPHRAADFVLHSSDNVFFYILGPLLRFVSPVFDDMFLMNHGPAIEQNEKRKGLPVVPLEEDSETLRSLLDFVYPSIEEPSLPDVSLLRKVGKAAKKYIMDIVEGKLRRLTMMSKLIIDEPLRIYAVATELDWECVANEAASRTLNCPLAGLSLVEELRSISGSDFYRFLEYRLRCDGSQSKETEKLMNLPRDIDPAIEPVSHLYDAALPTGGSDPFGPSPTANLILRSSDSVDFFVIEGLIRKVSPHFDGMFPLDKPQMKDGRAVIDVAYDSKSLRQLLAFIDPFVDDLDTQDLKLYLSVVNAVREYKMTVVERKLRKQAFALHLITSEPLRVYILATALQWEDVAKAAALNTLPRQLQELSYVKELSWITGADLYHLVSFRFRCGDVARQTLESDSDFMMNGVASPSQNYRCRCKNRYNNTGQSLISSQEVFEKLEACPRGSTIDEIYTMSFKGNGDVVRGVMSCRTRIGQAIEDAISKVPLRPTLTA